MLAFFSNLPLKILAVGLMALTYACSESSKSSNQKAPEASTKGKSTNAGDGGGDDEEDSEETKEAGETVAKGADKVFTEFCELAGETQVAQDELADYYGRFCKGGKPTELLTKSLIKGAYDGGETPSMKKIEDWSEDKEAKTTTGFFGNGIALPISAQKHFDTVAPNGGDEETLDSLASAGGAEGKSEVQETYEKGDLGDTYERGWKVHQTISKTIPGINLKVTTETIARTDQWLLKKNSAYLYTSRLLEGVKSIKTFDMFTACLQVGDDAYLLTLAKIEVENKGFHSVAVKEIQNTASSIIKAMYAAAEAAE